MTTTETVILSVYVLLLAALSVFALHRLHLAWVARRLWKSAVGPTSSGIEPTVLVQIPLYNERYVAKRIIDAVCKLRYPREKLFIQVLDDSTDATPEVVAALVDAWTAQGINIQHIRRDSRDHFKAGALVGGLKLSNAECVAIFDADFVPPPDFLTRLVPHFADPNVGMVQARWGHLNRGDSLLTQAQAILLDGHFVNEHGGRFVRSCFFNFNGTCGIWRRACIEDAGGWSGETLTEDLDLSFRAQLKGWRFVYRHDVEVPGELPPDATAFKSQQHRWAKGSIETARKLLKTIWTTHDLPLRIRIEATFHLAGNVAYPLVLLLALLIPWAISARLATTSKIAYLLDGVLLVGATGSLVVAYVLAERGVGQGRRAWLYFPLVLALGVGLAVNNSLAVVEAVFKRRSCFVRTPKFGGRQPGQVDPCYLPKSNWQAWIEVLLGVYLIAAVVVALAAGRVAAIPFLALFATGFLYLGGSSVVSRHLLGAGATGG